MVVWKLSAGSGKQDACHVIVVCDGLAFACLQGKQDARMEERRLTDPLMTERRRRRGTPCNTVINDGATPSRKGLCLFVLLVADTDRYYDLRARDSRFVNVVF